MIKITRSDLNALGSIIDLAEATIVDAEYDHLQDKKQSDETVVIALI